MFWFGGKWEGRKKFAWNEDVGDYGGVCVHLDEDEMMNVPELYRSVLKQKTNIPSSAG